jgi:hypothetical protein
MMMVKRRGRERWKTVKNGGKWRDTEFCGAIRNNLEIASAHDLVKMILQLINSTQCIPYRLHRSTGEREIIRDNNYPEEKRRMNNYK